MNKLIIIGNLTANPETRYVDTASGQHTVCNFTVAVNRYVRDRKFTEYFRVACWNKQAENAAKYLAKGSKVAVTGPVTARAYINRDGKAAASIEVNAETIEYLSKMDTAAQGQAATQAQPYQQGYDQYGGQPSQDDMDGFMTIPPGAEDELPFS